MIKYEGYIKNQQKSINQYEKMLKINLTKINDYRKIKNLSLEAIDKLNKNHPTNMAQASQISGVTINDLLAIKIYLEKTHE
jgi:tRNA uridine 5-carboxymethylaminomethyl modification enzyme